MALSTETTITNTATRGNDNPQGRMGRVGVAVQFLPLRACEGDAELLITQRGGLGRWRVPVRLSAVLGAVDGLYLQSLLPLR